MQNEDHLIDIEEAAKLLATSEDWLYRHHTKLSFAVKLSKKQLRFSMRGVQKFIEEQQNGGKNIPTR